MSTTNNFTGRVIGVEHEAGDMDDPILVTVTQGMVDKDTIMALAIEQASDEYCPLSADNFKDCTDTVFVIHSDAKAVGLANVDYTETVIDDRVSITIDLVAIFVQKEHRGLGVGRGAMMSIADHLNRKVVAHHIRKRSFDLTLMADFDSPEGEAVFNILRLYFDDCVCFFKEKLSPETTSTVTVEAGY